MKFSWVFLAPACKHFICDDGGDDRGHVRIHSCILHRDRDDDVHDHGRDRVHIRNTFFIVIMVMMFAGRGP